VLLIGQKHPKDTAFSIHRVACKVGTTLDDSYVFDACMAIKLDDGTFSPTVNLSFAKYLQSFTDAISVEVDLKVTGYSTEAMALVTPHLDQTPD
jgi:hypothetical protein